MCVGVDRESNHEQTCAYQPGQPDRSWKARSHALKTSLRKPDRLTFLLCLNVDSLAADVSDGRKQRIGDDASH
jgi:hypothetical protein